jgi:hypothetical protein
MGAQEHFAATFWVPLAEIRIGERRRLCVSAAKIERYRYWLEAGREAPPVRLVRQRDGFVVRDGRHRISAARAAGHTLIEATIQRIAEMVWAVARAARLSPSHGDAAQPAEHLACTEEERVRLPPSPLQASVVSTASTRPLYGRGAGSTPAGGSF